MHARAVRLPVELVVVAPLTRAMETAVAAFGSTADPGECPSERLLMVAQPDVPGRQVCLHTPLLAWHAGMARLLGGLVVLVLQAYAEACCLHGMASQAARMCVRVCGMARAARCMHACMHGRKVAHATAAAFIGDVCVSHVFPCLVRRGLHLLLDYHQCCLATTLSTRSSFKSGPAGRAPAPVSCPMLMARPGLALLSPRAPADCARCRLVGGLPALPG